MFSFEKKIDSVILLSAFEQDCSKALAARRTSVNDGNGIPDKRVSTKDTRIEMQGLGGELAFCKLFNVFPDFSLVTPSAEKGTDNGDAILPGGIRVDVKSTDYDDGHLIATPAKKNAPIDLFALMVCQYPKYIFKGFMTKSQLLTEDRYSPDRFHGYAAKQNDLKELFELSHFFNLRSIL
jgi:hypothetical protein